MLRLGGPAQKGGYILCLLRLGSGSAILVFHLTYTDLDAHDLTQRRAPHLRLHHSVAWAYQSFRQGSKGCSI